MIKGDGPLFNVTSLVIYTLMAAILLLALQSRDIPLFIQFAYLTISLGISALPRFLGYLYIPQYSSLPFGASDWTRNLYLTINDINGSLIYILLGILLMMGGFLTGKNIFKRIHRPRSSTNTPPQFGTPSLLCLILIIASIEAFLLFGLNVHVFNTKRSGLYNLIMVVRLLFSIDVGFFFVFALLLYKNHRSRLEQFLLYLLPIFYGLYMTAGASKGAIFRIVFFIFGLLLLKSGNFKLKLSRVVILFPILVSVSIPLYYLGFVARLQQIQDTEVTVEDAVEVATASQSAQNSPLALLVPILNRLGDIDYPVSVIALPEYTEKSPYMTVSYAAKSFINMLVPGNIFPEADLSTARTMTIIFRGVDPTHVRYAEYYNNETWMAWGIAHAVFGWGGGLLFIYLCSVLLHYLFLRTDTTRFSPSVKFVLKSWFLFVVIRASFYYNMGLDYSFFTALVAMGQWYVVYLILNFIERRWQEWITIVHLHRLSAKKIPVS